MQRLQICRALAVAAIIALAAGTTALASMDDGDGMPPGDDVCAGLSGGAQGLCNAYCNAQDCPSHPDKHSCAVLRTNFERLTGLSTFPCDGAMTATATESPTRTATALPPTQTPTDTPGATGTATATRTAAASATATAESTLTPTEGATATATATELPTLTPTAEGNETATAMATETATPTGIPTGTAAAAAASCDDVVEGATFVCHTFCDIQHCPSDPHPFCDELRSIFMSWTGTSVFPCEREATPTPALAGGACMGDCSGDGTVDIADLTQCLLIVLGEKDASQCVGAPHDGQAMTIGDMVLAVGHALDGCD